MGATVVADERLVDGTDAAATATWIGAELGRIEEALIHLTRQASAAAQLDPTLRELSVLATRIRPYYTRLSEALERRDLTYEDVARLEGERKRLLWLYRRARLEQIFLSKLRLERALRDSLYRQILEGYDEFSAMENLEARLRGLSDDMLAGELLLEEAPERDAPQESPADS